MRILIDHIPPDGQVVRIDSRSTWATDAARRALDAEPEGLEGELRVERKGHALEVTGPLAARAVRSCERCSEDVKLDLKVDAKLRYLPSRKRDDADEDVELEEDELDVGFYEGSEIAMDDVLCEALALALPPRVACEDVPACDGRTAELLASKGSSGSPTHPGLAALKNLR
jgi:uncharacterized metal-binding protein YceD (DUF177 family)